MKLLSHIGGDSDLLPAFFSYYTALGVTEFRVVLHGEPGANRIVHELAASFPIVVEHEYGGVYLVREMRRHLDRLLATCRGEWVLLVDSDEFVELPFDTLADTISALEACGAQTLYAEMLQRITASGALAQFEAGADPFVEMPMCSVHLYDRMGVTAAQSKHPLLFSGEDTAMADGGNHKAPLGCRSVRGTFRGVVHHFKWRSSVIERCRERSLMPGYPFAHQPLGFIAYLEQHDLRVPVEGAFPYSRASLFEQGLLKPAPPVAGNGLV